MELILDLQSDDKSVKIWNTTDWSLEASITQPFENSPGSTFFRRLRSGWCFAYIFWYKLNAKQIAGLLMELTLLLQMQ